MINCGMGSRKTATEESRIIRLTLKDPELQAAINSFSQLMDSAVGPHGRIQSLQNTVRGPIISTTSSTRLLSTLSLSQPCLRLIGSAIQGHLRNHHDSGLLAGALCLRLIQNAVELESVGSDCVKVVYGVLLQLVDGYLNSKDCAICVSVDMSKAEVMLAFVNSILISKPVCGLSTVSARHLSLLVLKAFLNSVPDYPRSLLSDRIFILQFDKSEVMKSELLDGLLLEWWEKPALAGQQEISIITASSQEIKVALVNVSMSGDTEESLTNHLEAEEDAIQFVAGHVMARMLAFCDKLCEEEVGILLCQKVIHPKVKTYLRHKGIVFVDRLGLQPLGYIQDLTGAGLISSVLVAPSNGVYGQLDSAVHHVVQGKSYLHLKRVDSCVCTLVLCAPVDEQLAELKCSVQSAVTGLYSVLKRPYLLCGGGCWQIHLANFVRCEVVKKSVQLCAQLRITEAQLQACCHAFTDSLQASAHSVLDPCFQPWMDSRYWHLWSAPSGVDITKEVSPFSCACGMLTSSDIDQTTCQTLYTAGSSLSTGLGGQSQRNGEKLPRVVNEVNTDWLVLDSLESVVSALRTAVMSATSILSISQYIHDVN